MLPRHRALLEHAFDHRKELRSIDVADARLQRERQRFAVDRDVESLLANAVRQGSLLLLHVRGRIDDLGALGTFADRATRRRL